MNFKDSKMIQHKKIAIKNGRGPGFYFQDYGLNIYKFVRFVL